jgi:alpha-tubulin suppressor-like RCC1 family protein
LWAWGRNESGAVPGGSKGSQLVPIQVGQDRDWVSIATGSHYAIALKKDGTLWGWGSNQSGQLGDGTMTDRPFPVRAKITLH